MCRKCASRYTWVEAREQLWGTSLSPSVAGCRDLTQFIKLAGCGVCFPVAVRNTKSRATWRGKDLFHLTLDIFPSLRETKARAPGRSLVQKPWQLTACSKVQSATTWVHLPRDGITHRGLDPPTSVSNQLVIHTMLPQMWWSQDPLIWPVLQLRSLFS